MKVRETCSRWASKTRARRQGPLRRHEGKSRVRGPGAPRRPDHRARGPRRSACSPKRSLVSVDEPSATASRAAHEAVCGGCMQDLPYEKQIAIKNAGARDAAGTSPASRESQGEHRARALAVALPQLRWSSASCVPDGSAVPACTSAGTGQRCSSCAILDHRRSWSRSRRSLAALLRVRSAGSTTDAARRRRASSPAPPGDDRQCAVHRIGWRRTSSRL